MALVAKKSSALRSERERLKDWSKQNEDSGRKIWRTLSASAPSASGSGGATPQECDKFRAAVEEADKIASLLAGLAARAAKADNQADVAGEQEAKVRYYYLVFFK